MDDKDIFKSNLIKYFYDFHVESDLTIEELVEDICQDVEKYLCSQFEKVCNVLKGHKKTTVNYEDNILSPEKIDKMIKKAAEPYINQ